jgi:mannitol operon transcriptional antiterminator
MKDRQKRMLRFLLSQDQAVRIEDMAQAFNIANRTVSRDLDSLESWLSLHGIMLDRKQNQGIQIQSFGRDFLLLKEKTNKPGSYLESISPEARQKLVLLYLIFHNRNIKISEIAYTFFISDTSVWNDLNALEQILPAIKLRLLRRKGVGIHLVGDEKTLRLKFISILTELFQPKSIIPFIYAYSEGESETLERNQFRLLMNCLRFPANNRQILELIDHTSRKLGYKFTMSGETVLYFYLQLSKYRIKSGGLLQEEDFPPAGDLYTETAKQLLRSLTERTLSGKLPSSEYAFLGLVIRSLEMGERRDHCMGAYNPENQRLPLFIKTLMDRMGEWDNQIYYLDKETEQILLCTLQSFLIRKEHQIPYWQNDGSLTDIPNNEYRDKTDIIRVKGKEILNLELNDQDLKYLFLHFQAVTMQQKVRTTQKYRCLICCFEGIGLASYLHSLISREFDEIDVVESTAVYKFQQQYLDQNQIDLILSTFPIQGVSIPVVSISLPLNLEDLRYQVQDVLQTLSTFSIHGKRGDEPLPFENACNLPFEELWQFIHGFKLLELQKKRSIPAVIAWLAEKIGKNSKQKKTIEKDLMEREKLGALEFEEIGLRVLHCKSGGVSSAMAGIIHLQHPDSRLLFLIAPDPCPDPVRLMLSHITLSIMESLSFREAIMRGNLNQIRRALINIYKDTFV